jgi:hypothetical protein
MADAARGKLKQPPGERQLEELRKALRDARGNPAAARGMIVHELRASMGCYPVRLVFRGYEAKGSVIRLDEDGRTSVSDGDSTLIAVVEVGLEQPEMVPLRDVISVERA